MDIAPFIKELILVRECIILPGFGGFETYYQPARKDVASKVIIPPSKKVVFRPDLVNDNGVLREYLSAKLKISLNQSDHIIREWIDKLKSDLQKNRKVFIESLGTFSLNDKDEAGFKPLSDDLFSAESYGLEKVPVDKQLPLQTETAKTSRKKEEPEKKKRTGWLVLGVAAVVMIFFLMILLFRNQMSDNYNVMDIFSFLKKDSTEVVVFGNQKNSEEEKEYDSIIDMKTSAKQALNPFGGKKINVGKKPSGKITDKYFIVAGSFKNMDNAEILKRNLIEEGFNPYIIELKNYHRVVISSFDNKEEALNELRRVRAQVNKSLWLMSV